jgi:hypothetical protein
MGFATLIEYSAEAITQTKWSALGREFEIAGFLRASRARWCLWAQLVYMKAPIKEQGQNLSPAFDLQFFGHVAIDPSAAKPQPTSLNRQDMGS